MDIKDFIALVAVPVFQGMKKGLPGLYLRHLILTARR